MPIPSRFFQQRFSYYEHNPKKKMDKKKEKIQRNNNLNVNHRIDIERNDIEKKIETQMEIEKILYQKRKNERRQQEQCF